MTSNPESAAADPAQTQELRQRVAESFDLVVNGVTDYAIFLLSSTGIICTWNEGARRMKGYEPHEIIGRHFSTFYPQEANDRGWPARELELATAMGRFEDEGWRLRKDGTRFWANVVITALFDQDRNLSGFLKITRDLTERKRQEDALRESEERFRLLVEGVKDYAIFMLDPQGRVSSWNEGAHRIKGYKADEIIGQHFSKFYPQEAINRRWPEHELEVAKAQGRFEDEGWRLRKDGTSFWANVVITALYDRGGVLRGFAKVTRDLTERRHTEALIEAGKQMNEFLAVVSHELRTPLNAMLGWIRMLRSGQLESALVERGLATIERNTLTQAQLVEDLLDISRIVSGKLRLNIAEVDIENVIQAAVDSVRLSAEAKGIRLQVILESGSGPVSGDAARLQQVLWNLLSNAIKFTPRGGRVRLELARVDSSVRITVSDTGSGISPEFLPHVFERFRQAETGISRSYGGLGLGLAIVKHLVEAHGGTVGVESAGEGRGATFTIELPIAAVRREAASIHPRSGFGPALAGFDCPPALRGARVLVVDDEVDTREMLELVLRQCHAEVRTAGSADEALALLDGWDADVLVSDIGMPGESGYELIRKVRQRSADRGGTIPAVALTAYARLQDRMQALAAGFQMHVAKPVEPAELVVVVKSLLEFKGKVLTVADAPPPRGPAGG
ncbi:MAG: PAS domain S-box protein [Polyangia bacterium]